VYSVVVIRHFVAFLATCCAATSGYAQVRAVPVVTVCEALRSLDRYRGRPVVVVGHSGWTFEGTFLHEKCAPDDFVQTDGRRWVSMMEVGGSPSGRDQKAARAFPVDDEILWQKFNEVSAFNPEPSPDFWGNWDAVYGEIESPNPLRQKRYRPGYSGNGYGAGGTVPASIHPIAIRTLIRGRQPIVVNTPPVPELPEPPTISIQAPSVALPDVLTTPPVLVPGRHAPVRK